jgi:hypothetical protein
MRNRKKVASCLRTEQTTLSRTVNGTASILVMMALQIVPSFEAEGDQF